jgi:hypothetical protein
MSAHGIARTRCFVKVPGGCTSAKRRVKQSSVGIAVYQIVK